jgi:hypothetical protein
MCNIQNSTILHTQTPQLRKKFINWFQDELGIAKYDTMKHKLIVTKKKITNRFKVELLMSTYSTNQTRM